MAGYLGSTPVPQATQHRESFTATAAQTTFATAGYTVGFVDVYLNGVHLTPADVTATNGSDVVLGACLVNDIVDVISHSAFELNAQTFTGTTTMDVVTATGVVTANGGAVFNEGSADVDFRVESNGNANMLFVDGGNNRVGIGTNSPAYTLDVSSTVQIRAGDSLRLQNAAGNAVATINCDGAGSNSDLKFTTAGAQVMRIDNTGAVTKPLQPAFLVEPASTQANFAVGSEVDVAFGTERFDQNADFASSVFTAPVTGKYQFNVQLRVENVDTAANYYYFGFKASNRSINAILDLGGHSADIVYYSFSFSMLIDMDASDTCKVVIFQANGTAQVDISTGSHFSGYLVA